MAERVRPPGSSSRDIPVPTTSPEGYTPWAAKVTTSSPRETGSASVRQARASSPRDSRSKDPSREPSTPDLVPWPAIWKPGSHSRVTLAQLAPTSFTRPTRAPCSSTTHWPA